MKVSISRSACGKPWKANVLEDEALDCGQGGGVQPHSTNITIGNYGWSKARHVRLWQPPKQLVRGMKLERPPSGQTLVWSLVSLQDWPSSHFPGRGQRLNNGASDYVFIRKNASHFPARGGGTNQIN